MTTVLCISLEMVQLVIYEATETPEINTKIIISNIDIDVRTVVASPATADGTPDRRRRRRRDDHWMLMVGRAGAEGVGRHGGVGGVGSRGGGGAEGEQPGGKGAGEEGHWSGAGGGWGQWYPAAAAAAAAGAEEWAHWIGCACFCVVGGCEWAWMDGLAA